MRDEFRKFRVNLPGLNNAMLLDGAMRLRVGDVEKLWHRSRFWVDGCLRHYIRNPLMRLKKSMEINHGG